MLGLDDPGKGLTAEQRLTNGAGVVRWKDVEGPSFASVKVANVATLRASPSGRPG